jgi:hypothetical protein
VHIRLKFAESPGELEVVYHRQGPCIRTRRANHLLSLGHAHGEWFFGEHVLAEIQRCENEIVVSHWRRTDRDCVDLIDPIDINKARGLGMVY